MKAVLLLAYALVLAMYIIVVRRRGGYILPDGIFVGMNSVMLVGTVMLVNIADPLESKYLWVVYSLTSLYVVSSLLVRSFWVPDAHASRPKIVRVSFPPWAAVLLGLSIAVSVAYFAAVGYLTALESYRALITGSQYDVATARLESYAGSKYFFPCYVNQFKNALLPALTLAAVYHLYRKRLAHRAITSAALIAICLVLLTGTGQRGAMMVALVLTAVALHHLRAMSTTRWAVFGAGAFLLFAASTVLLQRNASEAASATRWIDQLGVYAGALLSRVLYENPNAGIAAFRYTERLPIAWGSDWWAELRGILPGVPTGGIAGEVFASVYGSSRGTVPPSVWGSIYYNFGPVGSLLVVPAVATLFCLVTHCLSTRMNHHSTGLVEVVSVAGIAVSMGTWIAGSPISMLNQGLPAYTALYLYSRWHQRRSARVDQTEVEVGSVRDHGALGRRPSSASVPSRPYTAAMAMITPNPETLSKVTI